jgi:hypothetical protein
VKKFIFIPLSIVIGCLAAFLMIEFGYRFYLFGPRLYYQSRRYIDKSLFTKEKKHIFFVGDSFTAGFPYPVVMSYPIELERRLQDKDIKITNFGLMRTDLYEQIGIIKEISKLGPSLIVWGLATNDVCIAPEEIRPINTLGPQGFFIEKYIPPDYFSSLRHTLFILPQDCLKRKMNIFSTIKEVLLNYSYAYVFLNTRLRDSKALKFLRVKGRELYKLNEIKADIAGNYKIGFCPTHIFEAISYVKDFLYKKNIDFILVYVPQESDLNERLFEKSIRQLNVNASDYNRFNPRRCIQDFCQKNDILFLDPSSIMEKALQRRELLFINLDGHYNYRGNEIMADFLLRNIQKLERSM